MVWFQCEDCGENLKKPKLPNHFRVCSSFKLSCIDCGEVFTRSSVQSHTQCMTEAEKHGPKDQLKSLQISQNKPEKLKKNADVDINVGLSSRPPWLCSLCNTQTTSQQTLLFHADGKKHRAKAKAFHAAQKQPDQTIEAQDFEQSNEDAAQEKSTEADVTKVWTQPAMEKVKLNKKRKHDGGAGDLSNGEVIQAEAADEQRHFKKKNEMEKLLKSDHAIKHVSNVEGFSKKIKWKKLITATLKMNPDGFMKIKKLRKVILKQLNESGVTGDEKELFAAMMNKINTNSRFVIDDKLIRLASQTEES
ncbi:hypothetical protein AXF42_Ash002606 [Apostasia shenzhenica]|uniref:U1-type domain-containing protein n=1 Tax=Apostasia shenzhenica TaxID=1088818 RepID=A0A2I0AP21_9ASPA|nr:hypothetical protein AXF42_Ash002606 [Apostasia shenzhenica]